MSQNAGKTVVYFIVIGVIIAFLIYFYNNLSSGELDDVVVEMPQVKESKRVIDSEIDLELFQDNKFINLKKSDSEKSVFRAGRRNPFEPYE
ncbi:hypothetical protein GF382_00060 [Candidatus Falkowbacteria bacterium]|nr:hypothetical protein [Candidatus Falkowbacteria bacterium]